jgi:hypothetical protein
LPIIALAAGCGRDGKLVALAGNRARQRTAFFSRLAAEPEAGALKSRLQATLPYLAVDVERTGLVTFHPVDGSPGSISVEVRVVVSAASGHSDDPGVSLASELEQYLKSLAAATGTTVEGPTEARWADGRKERFSFAYKAAANVGTVTVRPLDLPGVRDALALVVVEED